MVGPNLPFGGLACGLVLGPLPSRMPELTCLQSWPAQARGLDRGQLSKRLSKLRVDSWKTTGWMSSRFIQQAEGRGVIAL